MVAIAAITAAAACQDAPTAAVLDGTNARPAASRGQHLGQEPAECFTAWAGHHAYDRDTVFFPRGELASGGATMLYRFSVYQPATKQVARGICRIPGTPAALARMDRRFGVARADVAGTMTVAIDPIVVNVCQYGGTYPNCMVEPPPPCSFNCDGLGDDGGGDSGWGGGGGGGDGDGDYVPPPSNPNDPDTLDDGPITFAVCVAGALGPDGWASIGLTAMAGYEVYQARKDVRNAYTDWQGYYNSPMWNIDTDDLYRKRYESARDNEKVLWRAFAGSGTVALLELGKAVAACAPVAGAPIP